MPRQDCSATRPALVGTRGSCRPCGLVQLLASVIGIRQLYVDSLRWPAGRIRIQSRAGGHLGVRIYSTLGTQPAWRGYLLAGIRRDGPAGGGWALLPLAGRQ